MTAKTRQNKVRNATRTRSKQIVKTPKTTAADAKLRQKPHYKSFYLHKTIKHPGPKVPSWFEITKKALWLMLANTKPLTWFVIIYGLLSIIFVSGLVSSININDIKEQIKAQSGKGINLSGNITILGVLLSSSFQASGEVSALYQVIFVVTSALALVWLYRQQQAGSRVTLKDAYYRGMYPLVPFMLVCVVIALQALPAALGNKVYGSVIGGGLAVTFVEQLFWFLFFLMLILLSLYLISTSLIALFVVTLPEMTPLSAIREARSMVAHRRASVLLKVVALVAAMLVIYVLVVFPAILISTTLAQVLFFLLTILAVPFAVAYLFVLYRELL